MTDEQRLVHMLDGKASLKYLKIPYRHSFR